MFWKNKHHVLVIGTFDHGTAIADVVNDFSSDGGGNSSRIHLVILAQNQASPTLKLILDSPIYRNNVTYLVGNATV